VVGASDNTNVPHTLLLADDSVTIQRVIELTFADEDVQVVAVSDGDQAIAQLEASPPDIVLADVGMPGKNGYEVAQYIQRSPRLAHIPVVLLTGAFEPVDQARMDEAGCAGVLAKPFEPQLVIGRVKDLLSKPRQTTAPQPPPPTKPPSGSLAAADLDSYFDRLDAAFADLDNAPDLPKSPPPSTGSAEQIDWFGTFPDTPPTDPPLASSAAPTAQRSTMQQLQAPRSGETPAPPATPQRPQPPTEAHAPSSTPPQLPSLADAFAAILAAEEGGPSPAVAPIWPSAGASNTAASDDLVEQVTRRVLDRLSGHPVLRETVADVVSSIAERLVREEIERIKASIK
jgi:CheY-like chemotaxis protein